MNIQMILSALPASHSGTSQPGVKPGQFALALGQAAQATNPDNAHATAFGAAVPQDLPANLATPEALLQALHAAGYSLNGDSEASTSDAQLDEIMARLELITADPAQPLPNEESSLALPLPVTPDTGNAQAASDTAIIPQALASAAVVAEPQPLGSAATATQNDSRGPLTALHPAAIAAQAGNGNTPALSGESARPADSAPAVALARTSTAQAPVGELQPMSTEVPRGSFIPEATLNTANGQGNTTAQPPMPAQTTLSAPVQSQAWSNQLGQQLVQFARQGGEQRIEMRLNPAELGPLSVTLKMTEQGAQAQFLSAHAPVRQVLEQAIPQLREALAEQGIQLGEASVGEQRQQNAQAFAGGNSDQRQRGTAGEAADIDLADSETLTPGTGATVALDGRVDLYA